MFQFSIIKNQRQNFSYWSRQCLGIKEHLEGGFISSKDQWNQTGSHKRKESNFPNGLWVRSQPLYSSLLRKWEHWDQAERATDDQVDHLVVEAEHCHFWNNCSMNRVNAWTRMKWKLLNAQNVKDERIFLMPNLWETLSQHRERPTSPSEGFEDFG